jgi:hypothetical protein
MQTFNIYELIPDSLRITMEQAAQVAAADEDIFREFYSLSIADQGLWSMRASRVVNFACVENIDLYVEIREELASLLSGIKNPSVKRNLMKTVIDCGLPKSEEGQGQILTMSFNILEHGPAIPGLQVYAMRLLDKLARFYPELGDELALFLETRLEDDCPSIRAASEQILHRFRKRQRP